MKKLIVLALTVSVCATALPLRAQNPPTQQPSAEALEKEKAELDKKAYRLLEQVIDEAQSLRLTENRVRVQINGADMLWDHNEGRARSLFALAADGVVDLDRNPPPMNERRGGPQNVDRRAAQLRQELVLAAARHDAALAYQLLAATKPPPAPIAQQNTGNNNTRLVRFQGASEDSLEQMLLGRIAAHDPQLAAQNAEEMLEKGQFPRTLTEVLGELNKQDAEAAAKLAAKTVKRIQSANVLTNNEAASLAQSLLLAGPRANADSTATVATSTGRTPVLEQGTYVDLLGSMVDLALKATPQAQNNQRRTVQRGRGATGTTPNVVGGQAQSPDVQIEQNGARRLLSGLQAALPVIDQYLPAKAALVRQKLTEVGLGDRSPLNATQTFNALQGNATSDTLVEAAAMAPPQMQSRIYQQAAFRAIDEGNTELARRIASDHLQANLRDSVMRRIDSREMATKAEGAQLDEVRQRIARLQSDNEKISILLQLSHDTRLVNPSFSTELLEEAKQMTNRRANNYDDFEQQLKVASAFASVDPARSFEVLDPAISQINELLMAATVLNGFEIYMFRDGELSLQGGNRLTATINRFGQELATLARNDFDRAETLAGRFQFSEARVMTRLAIVQGLLGVRPNSTGPVNVLRNGPGITRQN